MAERDELPVPREDAELARRLETALHDELGRGHVDVAELLRGTRRRTRRERVRRTAVLAAAAVAVAAVPLGIAVAQRDGGPATDQAASTTPTAPATTTAPTADPTVPPTAEPTPDPDPSSAVPERTRTGEATVAPVVIPSPVLRYGIPDSVGPTAKEVGPGMELLDEMDYPNGPTAMGQACSEGIPASSLPAERRTWAFSPGGMDSVDVVVSGWKDVDRAWSELVEDEGSCHFEPLMTLKAPERGETGWTASGESNGLDYGLAATRLEGGVIVAVTVITPGATEARDEAVRIRDVVVQRAVRAGIAAIVPARE